MEDRCLLSGGVIDPTFGSGGFVATQVGAFSEAFAVATSPSDGKIIAAGFGDTKLSGRGSDDAFAVVRYQLNGTLDSSFGSSGEEVSNLTGGSDQARSVAVQSDGKIVAAGFANGSIAVVRYNVNGSLDSSFGGRGTGIVFTNISRGSYDQGYSMVLQPDGKIVVAGTTIPKNATNTLDLALVRYNADGTLDSSFGSGGKVIKHFSSPIQSNGGV
jgi:uncharacterized delta-60 repeat protein